MASTDCPVSISAIAAFASSASFRSQYIFYIAMEPAALPWHSIPEDCPGSFPPSKLAIYWLPQPTKMTSNLRAWCMHACRAQRLGDQSKLPGAQLRPRVSPGLVRPLLQLHRLHAHCGRPFHKGHPTGMQSKAPSIVNSSSTWVQTSPTMLGMALALQLEIDYAGHGFGIAAGDGLKLYNVEQ